jgi:hypothetical protein
MAEVVLLERGGCAGLTSHEMPLEVDISLRMWRGRGYYLKSEVCIKYEYGIIPPSRESIAL